MSASQKHYCRRAGAKICKTYVGNLKLKSPVKSLGQNSSPKVKAQNAIFKRMLQIYAKCQDKISRIKPIHEKKVKLKTQAKVKLQAQAKVEKSMIKDKVKTLA